MTCPPHEWHDEDRLRGTMAPYHACSDVRAQRACTRFAVVAVAASVGREGVAWCVHVSSSSKRVALHSLNEPDELSQWLCHDNSTINIVMSIIMIATDVTENIITGMKYEPRTIIQDSPLIPRSAVTKPPPPVILLQVGVSRIYATESQPSVIFQSDSVSHIFSHIFNDWRRLSLYHWNMY